MSSAKCHQSENKICWIQRSYERHRCKVREARSTIDFNPPTKRPHVFHDAKRIQLERERQARIARDNFILLEKLQNIMHRRKVEESYQRLRWQESRDYDDYVHGETESYGSFEQTCLLTLETARKCLHTLGKSDCGMKYAYLGLNASNRDLTDISTIPTFKYVLFVNVSRNRLNSEALQVLTKMTYLLMIQADSNNLNTPRLDPMPYLQVLTMNRNNLTDTEGIAHTQLERLELNYNAIDVVSLNPEILKNLRILELRGNLLNSTGGIYIPTLTGLYLAENNIQYIEGLYALVNLEKLHLRRNRISNLDGFPPACEKLKYVNLRHNRIVEISEINKLSNLPSLKTLIILNNPVLELEADQQPEYRQKILMVMPHLKRIDKIPVQREESERVVELVKQMKEEYTTDYDT